MFKHFLYLEWKSFSRASSYKMNLAMKIIMGFVAVIYGFIILSLGISVFYLLQKGGYEPLSTINKFLIYWLAFDLMIKYFLQKSPIIQLKPLMTLPVPKNKIVSFLLGKSAISFFNFYPALFFIPFSIVLCKNGYSFFGVVGWHVAMFSLSYANCYLNLLINNKNSVFIAVASVMTILGGLQYFEYFDITIYTASVFQQFYHIPLLGIALLILPAVLYFYNFQHYKNTLKLDESIQKKEVKIKVENFTWLDRFGILGAFLKNDIKLLLRNKRSKSTIMISVLFLFYGLLIFRGDAYSAQSWKLFAGLFVTGGFLFTFGGLVPSWDSAYYPLMMSQNIKYREYLESKWWLMVFATSISIILASFYIYLGWEIYLAIVVAGIYNIGVNSHLVLLGGAYVKTPIDLTSGKNPFGDKKAFNLKTILVSLPKVVLPIIIFIIFQKLHSITAGYIAVGLLGILGLAFRNTVFKMVEKIYKYEKHATLAAYKEKN